MTANAIDSSPVSDSRDKNLQEQTFVSNVMNRDVLTVHKDTPVLEAAKILVQTKFGCLPVVDADRKLQGIISEHDLTKFLVSLLETTPSSPLQ